MNLQDSRILAGWFRSGASLADVESVESVGIVGNIRFSESARRAYRLAWAWSAPRFSGRAGAAQDSAWNRHGAEFVNRRIARCNRMIARFLQGV